MKTRKPTKKASPKSKISKGKQLPSSSSKKSKTGAPKKKSRKVEPKRVVREDLLSLDALKRDIQRLSQENEQLRLRLEKEKKRRKTELSKRKKLQRKRRKEKEQIEALREDLREALEGQTVEEWSKKRIREMTKKYGKDVVEVAQSMQDFIRVFGSDVMPHISRDGSIDGTIVVTGVGIDEIKRHVKWRNALKKLSSEVWARFGVYYAMNPETEVPYPEQKMIYSYWAKGNLNADARMAQTKIQEGMMAHYHLPAELRIQIHWNPHGSFPDRQ